ncbi:hypothetical protein, partial [Echinicola sediminis]
MKALQFFITPLIIVLLISCSVSSTHNNSTEKTITTLEATDSDSILYVIATTDPNPGVRKDAVSKITFGPHLTIIAKADEDPEVRKLAVGKISF